MLNFVEIPVFPTVTAKVTFQEFSWEKDISQSKFRVPRDFKEDPYRFPDLWHFVELTLIHVLTSLRKVKGHGDTEKEEDGNAEVFVGMDIPLSNLGNASAEMTLLF